MQYSACKCGLVGQDTAEVRAAAVFSLLDTDQDGQLSEEEFVLGCWADTQLARQCQDIWNSDTFITLQLDSLILILAAECSIVDQT